MQLPIRESYIIHLNIQKPVDFIRQGCRLSYPLPWEAPFGIRLTGLIRLKVHQPIRPQLQSIQPLLSVPGFSCPIWIPGPIATQSYFINEDFETRNLPVVSIATNPGNFWDPLKGIYVQDFKPEWEIPVNIELFENNGSDRAAFNEKAGVKINGLYSWKLPQKMLGVYFRKQYGSSSLGLSLVLRKKPFRF